MIRGRMGRASDERRRVKNDIISELERLGIRKHIPDSTWRVVKKWNDNRRGCVGVRSAFKHTGR